MIKLGLLLETSGTLPLSQSCAESSCWQRQVWPFFHSLVIVPQMAGNPEVVGFHDVRELSVRTLKTFVCILLLSCFRPGLSGSLAAAAGDDSFPWITSWS